MARRVLVNYFVLSLLFFIVKISAYSLDKTCNNGSSWFKLEKPSSRRFHENCCTGYRQKVANESTWIKCVPICIPACKNGICQAPDVCACDIGFKPDPKQDNNCIPHCSDGCQHGTCVSPEQCYCDHGYQYDLDVELCQPVCTEPCYNGTCVSPENCQCFPGYRKSETNECQPYCSVGCEHGNCIQPDYCACEPGWSHFDKDLFYPGECFEMTGTESNTAESSTDDQIVISIDSFFDAMTSTKSWDYDVLDDKRDKILPISEKIDINIFIVIGSVLFTACLIALVILVLKWTKLLDYILGKSYVIEDKGATDLNMEHLD